METNDIKSSVRTLSFKPASRPIRMGIDVGSTTVKVVILDDGGEMIYGVYERHRADIRSTIINVVNKAFDTLSPRFPLGEEQPISV